MWNDKKKIYIKLPLQKDYCLQLEHVADPEFEHKHQTQHGLMLIQPKLSNVSVEIINIFIIEMK